MRLSDIEVYNELNKQALLSGIIGDHATEKILTLAANRIKELSPTMRLQSGKNVPDNIG